MSEAAAITPGRAAYEAMHASRMARAPHGWKPAAWEKLGGYEIDEDRPEDWDAAARAACEAHGHAVALDRAMEDLDAVRAAIGWDDSAWVEWLVTRGHPVPMDLARTVTMIGQRPSLARDVRQLADERHELAAQLAAVAAERDRLAADLRDAEALLARWPGCPDGCGCRLGTEDADRRDCGCDGPCTMECRENGYPDAPSYRDAAVKHLTGERDAAQAVDREHREAVIAKAAAREAHQAAMAAGENGTSKKARKKTAGEVALQRLIELHRDEFSHLLDEEHAAASTSAADMKRIEKLIRAGLTVRAAERFAAESWPAGEIASGVLLVVRNEWMDDLIAFVCGTSRAEE